MLKIAQCDKEINSNGSLSLAKSHLDDNSAMQLWDSLPPSAGHLGRFRTLDIIRYMNGLMVTVIIRGCATRLLVRLCDSAMLSGATLRRA